MPSLVGLISLQKEAPLELLTFYFYLLFKFYLFLAPLMKSENMADLKSAAARLASSNLAGSIDN